ncbi:hypothetical protein INR49_022442 [Caranx melampygus]|nr:hypothetical protein INR49_022442 [Caranx melampygus]
MQRASCYKHLPQSPWVQWEERPNRSNITRDLKPQTRNASESGCHEVQVSSFLHFSVERWRGRESERGGGGVGVVVVGGGWGVEEKGGEQRSESW